MISPCHPEVNFYSTKVSILVSGINVAFGDKKHGDTIKTSIPGIIPILNRIADSFLMGELQTILA